MFEADPSPKRETECAVSAEETEAEHGKLPLSQLEAKPGLGAKAMTPSSTTKMLDPVPELSTPLGVFHLGGWVSNNPQPLPPGQQTHSPSEKAAMGEGQGVQLLSLACNCPFPPTGQSLY